MVESWAGLKVVNWEERKVPTREWMMALMMVVPKAQLSAGQRDRMMVWRRVENLVDSTVALMVSTSAVMRVVR